MSARGFHICAGQSKFSQINSRKLNFRCAERKIFSFGWDGKLQFYREDNAEHVDEISYDGRLYDVSISPDEASCVLCGTNGTEIWDLTSDPPNKLRNLTSTFSGACEFSEDGRQLALFKLYQYGIVVFDFATGKIIDELPNFFAGREPVGRTLSVLNGETG